MKGNRLIVLVAATPLLLGLGGCGANPAVSVEDMKDYTGNSPGGELWMVAKVFEHADDKQLEAKILVRSFGEIDGVDNSDVAEVSGILAAQATLRNDATDWEGEKYYFTYSPSKFKATSHCPLTLYYFVPPESANDDLRLVFDYTAANGKHLQFEAPVEVF
ncbi:MAG: hypothetical protein LBG11_07535 [Bifidobacteriaceae bacterium]|jgi:hypothetical protein|nr:hypothetical protein [Bifidobacteriaceae bacterium]